MFIIACRFKIILMIVKTFGYCCSYSYIATGRIYGHDSIDLMHRFSPIAIAIAIALSTCKTYLVGQNLLGRCVSCIQGTHFPLERFPMSQFKIF